MNSRIATAAAFLSKTHSDTRKINTVSAERALSPTVLLLEPLITGHRFGYLFWAAQAIEMTGARVVVATRSANRNDQRMRALTDNLNIKLVFCDYDPYPILTRVPGFDNYHWIIRTCAALTSDSTQRIDAIFIPYLDYLCNLSPIFGGLGASIPYSGILMTPHFHLRTAQTLSSTLRGLAKRYLFNRFLSQTGSFPVFSNDILLVNHYCREPKALRLLRDPASFDAVHFVATRPSKTRKNILLYGSIAMRKGVAELLTAYAHSDLPQTTTITIAGRQDTQARAFIAHFLAKHPELHTSIDVRDSFIASNDEIALFAAADILWVGYVDFFNMSGVAVQAGIAKKPILTSHRGAIGELTQLYRLGLAVDLAKPDAVIDGLKQLTDETLAQQFGSNAYRLFHDHTVENFLANIAEVISEMLVSASKKS